MKCKKCGETTLTNPLVFLLRAVVCWFVFLLLSHLTADTKFYTDSLLFVWVYFGIAGVLDTVSFLLHILLWFVSPRHF